MKRERYDKEKVTVHYSWEEGKHSPPPTETDGEASQPGPRLRRRGPRSREAQDRRLHRNQARSKESAHVSARHAVLADETLTIWLLNVRGWTSAAAEVTALLRLADKKPGLLCLNETFLNRTTKNVVLEGYTLVARRDRADESGWGGVVTQHAAE